MKKKIYFSLFAAIALLTTSCSQSDELLQPSGNKTVTFIAHIDGAIGTRALDASDEAISRALLEIYNADGELVGSRITGDINGDNITFSAQLESGDNYSCLFWTDGGSDAYNVDNLKAIAPGTAPSIAYYAKEDITASSTAQSVTLKHAIAKVVLEESGTLTVGDKVGVSFSLPAYTFNVVDGSCTAGTTGTISKEFTIGASLLTGEVGAFYTFAPADGASPVTMSLSYTPIIDGNKETRDMPNVPLKRNFRTVLRGAFEDMDATFMQDFSASLDKNWQNENAYLYILATTAAGQIAANPDKIGETLSPKGTLRIEGPVNTADITAIGTWAKEAANAGKLKGLDLSAVTGLTEIAGETFRMVSSLSTILLPASLEKIGSSAFYESGLTALDIPDNVNSLGTSVCGSCMALERVKLPAGLEEIPYNAFGNCKSLRDITLPESLKTIGNYAFQSTILPGVRIPAQVTLIGCSFQWIETLDYVLIESTLPMEKISDSDTPSADHLTFSDVPFDRNQNMALFLPNITDKTIADTYGLFFLKATPQGFVNAVYYNYTGSADGDRTDPANYTKWEEG